MQVKTTDQNLAHDIFICYSRRNGAFEGALEKALSNFTLPEGLPLGGRSGHA